MSFWDHYIIMFFPKKTQITCTKKMLAVAKILQIKTQITLQFQNIFDFLAIV